MGGAEEAKQRVARLAAGKHRRREGGRDRGRLGGQLQHVKLMGGDGRVGGKPHRVGVGGGRAGGAPCGGGGQLSQPPGRQGGRGSECVGVAR